MLIKTFFLILLTISLNAQTANEIIQKIQTKFSSVEDLKANFTQKINSSMNEDQMILSGKFFFKKKNKLRIEVKNRVIVSDGDTIWNYDKTADKVIISTYDSDYTSFSLHEIINSYPEQCKKEKISDQSGLLVVKLTPNDDQLNFKSAVIFVNMNDIVEKVEITDFNNLQFVFKLNSIELNNNLSEQLFNFKPTEGVEIIDLR